MDNTTLFPLLATLATVGTVAGSALAVLVEYRHAVARHCDSALNMRDLEVCADSVDNVSTVLVRNSRTLSRHYAEMLAQARSNIKAGVAIVMLGFIALAAGLLIAWLWEAPALGTVTVTAGLVVLTAAGLLLYQNRSIQMQIEESRKKQVSIQYLMTSVALARELPPEQRIAELKAINDHLRRLMDTLHSRRRR